MRHNRLNLSIVLLLGLGLTELQAQESINARGDNATGIGGSTTYTVGQIVCKTHTSSTGSVAEGVQQPYEISVITVIEKAKDINLSVSAYPNPATDFLQLNVDYENFNDLSYQLFDINGNLLQNEKITDNLTSILMGNLEPSTYFVKIIERNKVVKTFKIIKTQ